MQRKRGKGKDKKWKRKKTNKMSKQKDKTKSHRKILRKLDLQEIPRTNQPRTILQMNFRDYSV
jgi:hypothetical protein